MPNIKSAIKRVGVNQRKRMYNKKVKSSLNTAVKKADAAITAGKDEAAALVKAAQKKIDQACAKGVLPKNTASRKKSRLAKRLVK